MQIPIKLKFKYKSAEDLVTVGSKVTLQNCLDMPKQEISTQWSTTSFRFDVKVV